MYNVHQHWDPLKVCAVGASYPPEFYNYITNSKVRNVMERIATETEEDYQKLITLLHSFGVETIRPAMPEKAAVDRNGKFIRPPMCPRDVTAMIGNTLYTEFNDSYPTYDILKGASWPQDAPKNIDEIHALPQFVKDELDQFGTSIAMQEMAFADYASWKPVVDLVKSNGCNVEMNTKINSARTFRIGKDLYHGSDEQGQFFADCIPTSLSSYRNHLVDTLGHSDASYCPVVPGLIVSLQDISNYAKSFPGWEVIYLPGQSWDRVEKFLKIKQKNKGKWWVPGEELNDDFTNFVEQWLGHWVGYVEETVFDVNMLVIDEHNVVCNNYNKEVFAAFDRFGITPHIVNFRHRYFWDGGLHCITSDLHREGTQKDYFPDRDK